MPRHRKLSILTASSLLSTATLSAQAPNILFILADDLGYGDIGSYGQQLIRTPHLDALARDGVRMTNFYAGCAVSAPSRASLMTGLHTGHTRIRGNREIEPEGQATMATRPTIASILQAQGYRTGLFGKWGLGFPGSGAEPTDRGFDTFFGYNCQRQSHHYYPEYLWQSHRQADGTIQTHRVDLPDNRHNGRQVYAPELIQSEAIRFIRESVQHHRPFLAMMTYTLPHAELNLPHDSLYDYYRQRLTPRPWDGRDGYPPSEDAHASFAAMVERLDRYVGALRTELTALGVADNTVIIFTSDNGAHLEGGADPTYFGSSGPLRGFKRDLYEGGIRVPLLATWPGIFPAGRTVDTPAAMWDMLPTLADLADAPVAAQSLDGQTLAPLWRDSLPNDPKQRTFYWELHEEGGKIALRQGNLKLIALNLRSGAPQYELYDLATDPGEQHNLIAQRPNDAARLIRLMYASRRPSALFPLPL